MYQRGDAYKTFIENYSDFLEENMEQLCFEGADIQQMKEITIMAVHDYFLKRGSLTFVQDTAITLGISPSSVHQIRKRAKGLR